MHPSYLFFASSSLEGVCGGRGELNGHLMFSHANNIPPGDTRLSENLPHHSISFSCCFCRAVRLVGNLTLYLTMKLPLSLGFLERGMPWPGNVSDVLGLVGPAFSMLSWRPSIVVTVRFQPVSASLRSRSIWWIKSSPSRVKSGCAFCVIC